MSRDQGLRVHGFCAGSTPGGLANRLPIPESRCDWPSVTRLGLRMARLLGFCDFLTSHARPDKSVRYRLAASEAGAATLSGNGPRRRRGVRASPERLQQALAESGLKTRIAVAERIADLEASVSVPSGMVNRAFRGVPVDPQSLQRIARALDVEAHTLYLASQEESMEAEDGSAGLELAEATPASESDANTSFRKAARWTSSHPAALIGIAMLAFLCTGAWIAGALWQPGVILEDTRPADGSPSATSVVMTSINQTRPDLESALAQALAARSSPSGRRRSRSATVAKPAGCGQDSRN